MQLFGLSLSQFVPGQCLIRNCDQSITGRNLRYSRVLQIIQTEVYLTEADLDEIRKRSKRDSEDGDYSSSIHLEDYDGNRL